jgi:hypothetical protein
MKISSRITIQDGEVVTLLDDTFEISVSRSRVIVHVATLQTVHNIKLALDAAYEIMFKLKAQGPYADPLLSAAQLSLNEALNKLNIRIME